MSVINLIDGFVKDASPNFGGAAWFDANGELKTPLGRGGTIATDNVVTALLIRPNGEIVAVEAVSTKDVQNGSSLQRFFGKLSPLFEFAASQDRMELLAKLR